VLSHDPCRSVCPEVATLGPSRGRAALNRAALATGPPASFQFRGRPPASASTNRAIPQLQAPDTQAAPVAQGAPQSPQFFGSLDVSTQASTETPASDGIQGGGQSFTGAGGH
jgi:hypothetical protein